MRFDYDRVDWRFVARILNENSVRLSRTRRGVSDSGTSSSKEPLRLAGDALRARSAENEESAHRHIFEHRQSPTPNSGAAVQDMLYAIADLTNDGLLPAGRFRTWEIAPNQHSLTTGKPISGSAVKVQAAQLPDHMARFCESIHTRWSELAADPIPLAAWAEWELNVGSLHPFYDGCGRIARTFGAWLLLYGSSLPPLYESPDAYFDHANVDPDSFTAYVRCRVSACDEWLRSTSSAPSHH